MLRLFISTMAASLVATGASAAMLTIYDGSATTAEQTGDMAVGGGNIVFVDVDNVDNTDGADADGDDDFRFEGMFDFLSDNPTMAAAFGNLSVMPTALTPNIENLTVSFSLSADGPAFLTQQITDGDGFILPGLVSGATAMFTLDLASFANVGDTIFFQLSGVSVAGVTGELPDFNFQLSEVPVPGAAILLLTGIAGFGFARRKQAA